MTQSRRPACAVAAATLLVLLTVPAATSPALADDPPAETATEQPKKKGFFNRLRGGGSEEAPAEAEKPAAPEKASSRSAYQTKHLESSIKQIRRSVLGTDPAVVSYLERIERGEASATQLNDFAGYLLRRGVPDIAEPFQMAATEVAPDQPSLWVNLGTIEQARGKRGAAAGAYKKAIDLDPTNGLAHYGLGVVADSEGDYDGAIENYRRALLIDPTLADPKVNPQVVNNERLLAVQLLLARDRAGALSLPLLPGKPGEKGGSQDSGNELPPSDR